MNYYSQENYNGTYHRYIHLSSCTILKDGSYRVSLEYGAFHAS